MSSQSAARIAPATARNRDPILTVLQRVLPRSGVVLEIASGTGEHAAYFAQQLPGVVWQPSDPNPEALASIRAHAEAAALPNLRPPLALDVRRSPWPVTSADGIVCINMIHIAPWTAAQALFAGARALLPQDAPLYLYGPFRRGGHHTAPSNAAFDASLQSQDPDWGVRDLADVEALAQQHGFRLIEVVEMPANNLSVVFRRSRSQE